MKAVFKKGMEVYDQVFFPDTNGKIVEIYNRNGKIQLEVKFFSRHRLEPLCMQSSFFYDEKGNMTSAWDRTCETPTLSTKPYEIEFQGFEQKAPVPTFEEVWDEVERIYEPKSEYDKDEYKGYPSQKLADAAEALRRLLFLRDCYNEGWQPNWEDDEWKYFIEYYRGELEVNRTCGNSRVLHFKSRDIAKRFLKEQKELLEIAKPLL